MADKTIKHFVFTRFFSWKSAAYPHDIFDVEFLSKQLLVANHVLKSLENQTNKNFELIFVLHPNFFDNPKYEFVFSTLKDSTTLPIRFMRNAGKNYLFRPEINSELSSLIRKATDEYDFVITTRMDFDDFVFKDAVADTQAKIDECDSVLSYGYNNGYDYISTSHELYSILRVGDGHKSVFQSLILKSSFAKDLPCFTVENFNHDATKAELKKFLAKNNVEFSESMFQQNNQTNAYIYVKHEFSYMTLVRQSGKIKIPDKVPLTTKDITKKQLEEEFGFYLELNSIK